MSRGCTGVPGFFVRRGVLPCPAAVWSCVGLFGFAGWGVLPCAAGFPWPFAGGCAASGAGRSAVRCKGGVSVSQRGCRRLREPTVVAVGRTVFACGVCCRAALHASCFLLPASCFPPPASCLPPSAVEMGRTVKNSGKHPEKGCFPFGCRSELGGWPDGWWYGGFFRLSGASEVPAAPARLALRGSPFAAHLSRFALHGWPPHGCPLLFTFHLSPFTFHFSLSANPCEMKVSIGSRPVRQ